MTLVENIVRPFQGSSPYPQFRVFPAPNHSDPRIVDCALGGAGGRTVSWTIDGEGRVIQGDVNKFRETSRTSEEATVHNPDDPDQFVTFCRARKINLTPDKTSTGAPKTSTYDTSGGYHDLSGGGSGKTNKDREYNFKYPSGGCGDSGSHTKGCA